MEKKKSKGFFSTLFAPKSGSCCCNVQFEEIPEEKTANAEEVKNLDSKMKDVRISLENKK